MARLKRPHRMYIVVFKNGTPADFTLSQLRKDAIRKYEEGGTYSFKEEQKTYGVSVVQVVVCPVDPVSLDIITEPKPKC